LNFEECQAKEERVLKLYTEVSKLSKLENGDIHIISGKSIGVNGLARLELKKGLFQKSQYVGPPLKLTFDLKPRNKLPEKIQVTY